MKLLISLTLISLLLGFNFKSQAATKPNSWELSGALAVRSKSKASSVAINWQQQGASTYVIRLMGPLGSGSVIIRRQGNQVTLRDGTKILSANSAEALLTKTTGIQLPVRNLYYWARGIPAPGAVQGIERNSKGQLLMFKQAGYTIDYVSYKEVAGSSLPTQIKLQGPNLFIKLVIKKWKI